MSGAADGVGLLRAGDGDSPLAGGALALRGTVARAASPSWLAPHPRLDVVYAALEGEGRVAAFSRTGEESFAPLGATVEVGDSPCHAAVAPDGSALIVSCYGDGAVVRVSLDDSGRLGRATTAAVGDDPHALPFGDEVRAPHAHAAAFLPDGRMATTDLGLDVVRIWRPGADTLHLHHEVVLPRGSGPRHMVMHPSGYLYVVTEYSCEVFALRADATGRWALSSGAQLGALPGDVAAELAVGIDDRFLYAGLRGSDTIATVRIGGDGSALAPVALSESGVGWPRHHVVVRDELLVAGQLSNTVVSATLDQRTGVPGRVRHRIEAPSPTRILPLR